MLFFNPEDTLRGLAVRPRWFIAVLATALLGIVNSAAVMHQLGLQRVIEEMITAKSSVDPQAMIQNAMSHQQAIIISQTVSGLLGPFFTVLISAGGISLLLACMQAATHFKFVTAVLAHTFFYVNLVRLLITLPVLYINNPDTFHFMNPIGTNVAFYINGSTPFLDTLYVHIDYFRCLGSSSAHGR